MSAFKPTAPHEWEMLFTMYSARLSGGHPMNARLWSGLVHQWILPMSP